MGCGLRCNPVANLHPSLTLARANYSVPSTFVKIMIANKLSRCDILGCATYRIATISAICCQLVPFHISIVIINEMYFKLIQSGIVREVATLSLDVCN